MKLSIICKGCMAQLHMPVVIRGILSIPFRLFGVKPSRMNPNICTMCEETPKWLSSFVKERRTNLFPQLFYLLTSEDTPISLKH